MKKEIFIKRVQFIALMLFMVIAIPTLSSDLGQWKGFQDIPSLELLVPGYRYPEYGYEMLGMAFVMILAFSITGTLLFKGFRAVGRAIGFLELFMLLILGGFTSVIIGMIIFYATSMLSVVLVPVLSIVWLFMFIKSLDNPYSMPTKFLNGGMIATNLMILGLTTFLTYTSITAGEDVEQLPMVWAIALVFVLLNIVHAFVRTKVKVNMLFGVLWLSVLGGISFYATYLKYTAQTMDETLAFILICVAIFSVITFLVNAIHSAFTTKIY